MGKKKHSVITKEHYSDPDHKGRLIKRLIIGTVILVGILIFFFAPLKTVRCSFQAFDYAEDVPYQETEYYYVPAQYEVTKTDCDFNMRALFDMGATNRILLVNHENRGGNFVVTHTFNGEYHGQNTQSKEYYIEGGGSGEFYFSTDIDWNEAVRCSYRVEPFQVQKSRQIIKYRRVEHFKTDYYTAHLSLFGKC